MEEPILLENDPFLELPVELRRFVGALVRRPWSADLEQVAEQFLRHHTGMPDPQPSDILYLEEKMCQAVAWAIARSHDIDNFWLNIGTYRTVHFVKKACTVHVSLGNTKRTYMVPLPEGHRTFRLTKHANRENHWE